MNYKFGIIGLGFIADFHAKEMETMESAELYSCMSRSDDKAKIFSEKSSCTAYTNLDKMLKIIARFSCN
ncbi:MAG: Gfo/Idh/MocA family oxidoreductase [Spirochaetales bacterium]|nr:Gfo/Idh/MocA family oxidoreductase [Spirochaetales bacterium]